MRAPVTFPGQNSCNSSSKLQGPGISRATRVHQLASRPAAAVRQPHPAQQQQQQQPFHAALRATLAASSVSLLLSSPVQAATAEANFGTKCVGCHVGGGNIIQAGATLFQADLVKNGAADSDSLYKLIYSGKGRMPGFGQECAPKAQCTFGPKLSDEEVQQLVQYVQDQAAAGWKQ